jgi:tight adherence protein C
MTALLIAIFAAVALFAASALILLIATGERSPTQIRLAELSALSSRHPEAAAIRDRVEGIIATITAPLAPFRDWVRSNDEQLGFRLALAGFRKPQDAETFLSIKIMAPLVGILIATFASPQNILLFALVLGAVAFFAPDMLLFYLIGKRKTKLAQALPDVLDLLVICMEAGLGIDQAVLKIADEIQPVYPELSEELLIISREQRAGRPRIEAWRSMADRVDLDTIRQFVAMLVQTERLGTPIARALGAFADNLRTKRMLLAEENAAKTTIKLIFPLVLFIFPTLFVVLLGPAAIAIMQGLEQAGK